MAKKNLAVAKRAKNDEFYTRLQDVEAELIHYRPHFKNKTVFLNCDDPTWSAFWRHFHKLFGVYGLKKLIATHYEGDGSASYAMVYEGGDDADASVGERIELIGNGDFRSDECVEFLKESDIVVTNPPFSLFREYVAVLMEHEKKFLIIGNKNSISYKEFFPLLKSNEVWIGYNNPSEFDTPNGLTKKVQGLCRWFTNLDIQKRHEDLFLSATYYKKDGSVPQVSLDRWPHYDNYDAIEVGKVKDIPVDYAGVMGVPITFLDKYNPDQFEILDINPHFFMEILAGKSKPRQLSLRNAGRIKDPYARILIRARHPHPAGVPVVFDEYE